MSKSKLTMTSKKKIGLGRGLGSLLGENTKEDIFTKENAEIDLPEVEGSLNQEDIIKSKKIDSQFNSKNRIFELAIEKIKPNPNQPRKIFEEKNLSELSLSIKQSGVIQPLLVRKLSDEFFEIVAGERRWRASQRAGLKEVPVIIKEYKNNEALEVALIENIQRKDLNPIEEAEALKELIQNYKLTQEELSKRLGKERSSITNLLRLLSLSSHCKKLINEELLSLGQAKVLLALSDWSKQDKLAKEVVQKKISVRELEKKVKALKEKNNSKNQKQITPKEALNIQLVDGLSKELQKLLGQKVVIDYKSGRGRIKVAFHSDDELNALVNKIRESWK